MHVLFADTTLGGRRLAVVPHLRQMGTHGLPRHFRIVLLHCFKNSLVMNLAALWTTGNAKDAQALLAKQSDNGIQKRQD